MPSNFSLTHNVSILYLFIHSINSPIFTTLFRLPIGILCLSFVQELTETGLPIVLRNGSSGYFNLNSSYNLSYSLSDIIGLDKL